MNEDTFVTLGSGKTVKVHAVSDLLVNKVRAGVEKRLRTQGVVIDRPTYQIKTAAGVIETHLHDEASLTTEEDKALWQKYQDGLAQLERERSEKTTRAWLSGIEVEMPTDDRWLKRQRALDVDIPEDEDELYWHYVMTEVVVSSEDYFKILGAITKLSYEGAVAEEDIEAAINSFRSQLQAKPERQAEAVGKVDDQAGALAVQPSNDGGPGSQSLGTYAQPVPAAKRRRSS